MQESKVVVWEGFKIAEERREAKHKGARERCTHLNAEFQRIARWDKKAFLSDQGYSPWGRKEFDTTERLSTQA